MLILVVCKMEGSSFKMLCVACKMKGSSSKKLQIALKKGTTRNPPQKPKQKKINCLNIPKQFPTLFKVL